MRSGYFAPEENEALFARDAELDRYTLARLQIERNSVLSKSRKEAALRKQPGSARSNARNGPMRQATSSWLNRPLHSTPVASANRRATPKRQAAHGDAAARNLAQLDREERNWQTRLGDYDAARKSGASEQDLQRVRGRFFSESEQLRLPGALTARKQAAVRLR